MLSDTLLNIIIPITFWIGVIAISAFLYFMDEPIPHFNFPGLNTAPKRERHLIKIATALSWEFQPSEKLYSDIFFKWCANFRVFSPDHQPTHQLRNVFTGKVAGFSAKIFDTPTFQKHLTILMIELPFNIPRVNLHPRTWLDPFVKYGKGVLTPSFTCHGDDMVWLSQHLTPEVIQYYAASPLINIEAKGRQIIFYHDDIYGHGRYLPPKKETYLDLINEARMFIHYFSL